MNRIEKLIQAKNFKSLPEEIKLLASWVDWLSYDWFETGSSETYHEYIEAVNWLRNELAISYGANLLIPKQVDESNATNLWFNFAMRFDKDSLLDMDYDRSYEIKIRNGKYCMVEVNSFSCLSRENKNRFLLYNYLLRRKTELGINSKWLLPYLGYLTKNNLGLSVIPKKYKNIAMDKYESLILSLGVDASMLCE